VLLRRGMVRQSNDSAVICLGDPARGAKAAWRWVKEAPPATCR